MGEFIVKAGAKANVLDADELKTHLRTAKDAYLQDLAHGVKGLKIGPWTGTVAAGNVSINTGAQQLQMAGPREGYTWFIQALRTPNLATGDVLKIWRNESTDDHNYLGALGSGTASVFTPGKASTPLLGGDILQFTGAGLTATGVITVVGYAIEVPGYHEWKILT